MAAAATTEATFGAALTAASELWPTTRLVFDGTRPASLSLSELLHESRRVASGFQRLGVGPGDTVAIQLPNWRELPIAYFGAFLAGAVVVPIVHIYGASEMSFILRDSRAKVLIGPDEWAGADFTERRRRLEFVDELEHIVVVSERGELSAQDGDLPWSSLLAPSAPVPVDRAPEDLALIIYTSGTTTGEPKGVQHSHRSMTAELASIAELLDLRGPEDSLLNPWPAGHVAGMIGVCQSVFTGASTVLMDRWDPARAVELIAEFGCRATSGAPVHLASLLDHEEAGDLSSLAVFLVGAAAVSPTLVERADRAGVRTFRCFGATEHPTVTASRPADPVELRAGSDGFARAGNEVRIVDTRGVDRPVGSVGEIITRGPEMFLGYRNPEHDADAFYPGGWYRTGDLGRLDADGYLTVTDRIKDIIIRGGENIASKEVEDLLMTHPSVVHAAVVGERDERLGERVAAFVVLAPAATLTLAEVVSLFRDAGVARQKTPERLVVSTDLPRTASGKVQKFALRRHLEEARA